MNKINSKMCQKVASIDLRIALKFSEIKNIVEYLKIKLLTVTIDIIIK